MSYFGVEDINVHIKLADENDAAPAIKPSLEKLEKKPAVQQQQTKSEIEEEEEENEHLLQETLGQIPEKNNFETTENKQQDDIAENLSDQSKMVMELFNGKYYSQNGVVYKCNRDTQQAVYNPLADLVGIYVEIATE